MSTDIAALTIWRRNARNWLEVNGDFSPFANASLVLALLDALESAHVERDSLRAQLATAEADAAAMRARIGGIISETPATWIAVVSYIRQIQAVLLVNDAGASLLAERDRLAAKVKEQDAALMDYWAEFGACKTGAGSKVGEELERLKERVATLEAAAEPACAFVESESDGLRDDHYLKMIARDLRAALAVKP